VYRSEPLQYCACVQVWITAVLRMCTGLNHCSTAHVYRSVPLPPFWALHSPFYGDPRPSAPYCTTLHAHFTFYVLFSDETTWRSVCRAETRSVTIWNKIIAVFTVNDGGSFFLWVGTPQSEKTLTVLITSVIANQRRLWKGSRRPSIHLTHPLYLPLIYVNNTHPSLSQSSKCTFFQEAEVKSKYSHATMTWWEVRLKLHAFQGS